MSAALALRVPLCLCTNGISCVCSKPSCNDTPLQYSQSTVHMKCGSAPRLDKWTNSQYIIARPCPTITSGRACKRLARRAKHKWALAIPYKVASSPCFVSWRRSDFTKSQPCFARSKILAGCSDHKALLPRSSGSVRLVRRDTFNARNAPKQRCLVLPIALEPTECKKIMTRGSVD